MNVRIPKCYNELSKGQKEKLNEYYNERLYQERCEDIVKQQEKWLKFACILLNEKFDFTKEECLLFLGNWREYYARNSAFETLEEQLEYLNTKIENIFGKDGYPEMYIERLKRL